MAAGCGALENTNFCNPNYLPWFFTFLGISTFAFGAIAAWATLRIKVYDKKYTKYFGITAIVSLIIQFLLPFMVQSQPQFLTQHIGNTAYKVPRVYTQTGENTAQNDAKMTITYCKNTLRGIYQGSQYCDEQETIFDQQPLTSAFQPARFLREVLKQSASDNRVANKRDWIEFCEQTIIGDTVSCINFRTIYRRKDINHFILDSDDNLILFASCPRSGKSGCDIVSQTQLGRMFYRYDGTTFFNPEAWRAHETRVIDMVKSWQ
ncbi:hypothetical protein [Paramylibacter kogurei]|uniref:hypothetical protein n=1 Tax=Paramylibacter kogurei TaxID=1889778 RepID=UPI0010567F5E|nr:hypothetical protein [Amylibacter kogurei]